MSRARKQANVAAINELESLLSAADQIDASPTTNDNSNDDPPASPDQFALGGMISVKRNIIANLHLLTSSKQS
jgi:hypothetical protein